MSRTKKKYIKESDRFKYFADKLIVSHWFEIESGLVPHGLKFIKAPELNTTIKFHKLGSGLTRITFFTYYNLNRILRYWGNTEFRILRSGSDFHHDDNFIPYNLRKVFVDKGFTHAGLRKEAAEILYREIRRNEKMIIRKAWEGSYPVFHGIKIKRAIFTMEICYDLESITPFEFSKDPEVKKQLNRAAKKISFRNYDENGQATILDVDDGYEEGNPVIMAKLSDKSILKFYTKEIHNTINLNRIERSLRKIQLEKLLVKRGRQFKNSNEFLDLLGRLAQETFDLIFSILNVPLNFTDKTERELIRKFCRSYYGKHWPDAFKDFTTGGCYVGTGKRGNSTSAVKRITLKLKREEGAVRRDAVGRYMLDMHKLKST